MLYRKAWIVLLYVTSVTGCVLLCLYGGNSYPSLTCTILLIPQSRDTLVHKLHDKQLQVFTNFLACFVKPENLPPIPRILAGLELKGDKLLPARDLYVCRVADRFRREHPQHHVSGLKWVTGLLDQSHFIANDKGAQLYQCVIVNIYTAAEALPGPRHTSHVGNTCRASCHRRAWPCSACLLLTLLQGGTPRLEVCLDDLRRCLPSSSLLMWMFSKRLAG